MIVIDLGTGSTVAVGREDNKQNHCRTGEELRRGFPLVAIAKRNKYITNSKLVLHLYWDIGVEIEVKCYLFHTLPGNRYNFIILKSIR